MFFIRKPPFHQFSIATCSRLLGRVEAPVLFRPYPSAKTFLLDDEHHRAGQDAPPTGDGFH